MLQAVSTTRTSHSNRFKRCESDQPGHARSRSARLRPFFPVQGLTPDSPCPHGAKIHDGDVCGVRHCVSHHTQRDVETSPAPPPENAEDRTLRHIREWEEILGDGEGIDPRTVMEIRQRIKCLRAELDESSGNPTRCSPDLPGGIGTLKAKPSWEVKGLDFTVQAWSKGEAVAQFSARLRRQGERGRFSVPISNPKRVKSA